jgi:hypothetical protein
VPGILWTGHHAANMPSDHQRDLALERKHVAQFPIIGIRPELLFGMPTDQLGGDPEPIALPLHRAGDNRIDVQCLRNLRHRLACALELHNRGARDHSEALQAAESDNHGLGHPVGHVLLIRMPVEVLERQDSDRPNRHTCVRQASRQMLRSKPPKR